MGVKKMGRRWSLQILGHEKSLKLNCVGCEQGASIEHSEACMREVLQALAEHLDVDEVVLTDVYAREYSGESLKLLKDVARVWDGCQFWPFRHLSPEGCERCKTEREELIRRVLEQFLGDPSRALRQLEETKKKVTVVAKRGAEKCRRCRIEFLEQIVKPLISEFKKAKLARSPKERKGREWYALLLNPTIRPCFIKSKIQLRPPPGARLEDAYEMDGGEVRIYRLPGELQYLYFLIPPEYKLPPEQVSLLQEARQELLEKCHELDLWEPRAREKLRRRVRGLLTRLAAEGEADIPQEKIEELSNHLTKFTIGFGVLETLLNDGKVQDVYVDAPIGKTPVHITHLDFEECLTNIFLTPEDAKSLVSRFRAISGRPFSEASPVLDLELEGTRVTAIQNPLSPEGAAFAFRRHKSTPWTLPQFIQRRFLTPTAAGLLSLLVDSQSSLLITGSRGSGKTSLLGALMLEILPKFRIISVEDTLELPTKQLRDLGFKIQSLRVQSAVSGSGAELRADDALKTALRLGESVLVIGEVRSSEAKTLYEAMRVGAAGNSVMGTIHGSTARDVFERIVYDLGIPPSSFKATDAIIVAAPIRVGGGARRVRRLTQITEVRKDWKSDPVSEGGFANLMVYKHSDDTIRPTSVLKKCSQLLASIAEKWGTGYSDVLKNLELRAEIQKRLVETSSKLSKPEVLEAEFVVKSNLVFHSLLEEELQHGRIRYGRILDRWMEWLGRAV